MTEIEQLETISRALDTADQRATWGAATVELALAVWRERIAELTANATSDAEPQRRQITVLFADVSGFTAMSETMDAEDVATTMNALWRRLDGAIIAHGGKINQHIGDAVMALWGVEQAQETDAAQAVRAALAMHHEIQDFNTTSANRRYALQMRIGINSGLALLSNVGRAGEFTIIGDTVTLAPQLEHAAPVGGVLIAHETMRRVRGLFDMDDHVPLIPKGKTEPIETHTVKRARLHAFRLGTRGVEGVETHLIGREAELAQLQTAMLAVVEKRQRQALTVFGESGIGKTRLLYEFSAWAGRLPQHWRLLKGRSDQATARLPYALWRDIFSFRFEIQDSDSLTIAREKFVRGVLALMPHNPYALWHAHLLGQLIGLDFAASPHVRGLLDQPQRLLTCALHSLTQFFTALTTSGAEITPVALLLDDLHWADDSSLDLLEQVLQHLPADAPLFVLSVARPNLLERRPQWGASGTAVPGHLILWALPPEASRQLATEILRKVGVVPEALLTLITNGAEGNPFYIEELVKWLIDLKVVEIHEDHWQVNEERLATVTPPTLTRDVLKARLEPLTDAERETLYRAAVLGRLFWDSALEAMRAPGAPPIPMLASVLETLRAKELIFVRALSAFADTQEYTFKHVLLRHVAYEQLPASRSATYHEQAAQWLIAHSGERLNDYAGLAADYFQRAGHPLRAADYLYQAAKRALAVGAPGEAIAALEQALALTSAQPEALPRRAGLQSRLGEAYVLRGDSESARTTLNAALPLARAQNDTPAVLLALKYLGQLAFAQADYVGAQARWEDELKEARRLGQQNAIAGALHHLGSCLLVQGQGKPAQTYYDQALAIYRSARDRLATAEVLIDLSQFWQERHDYSASQKAAQEALSLAQEVDCETLSALATIRLGMAQLAVGKTAAALDCLRAGWRHYQAVADAFLLFTLLPATARWLHQAGQPTAAIEALGRVRSMTVEGLAFQRAGELALAELRIGLDEALVEAALERGKGKRVEEVYRLLE